MYLVLHQTNHDTIFLSSYIVFWIGILVFLVQVFMNKSVAISFRISLIILVAFLSGIFNFERLQYLAGFEIVAVHNFLYLLILLFIVKIVIFPIQQDSGLILHCAFAVLIYLVLRTTLFSDGGLFGEVNTYATISEILFLLLGIILTTRTMRFFYRMEAFMDEVFFPGLEDRVLEASKARKEIDKEISRCRRYKHPLSLVMIKPERGNGSVEVQTLIQEIQQYGVSRMVGASVGKLLAENTRRSDTIIRNDDNNLSYLVLCPETPSDGASSMAEGIFELAKRKGITISYGTAVFPDDAITFDDLITKAEKNLGNRTEFVPGTMLPETNH